PRSRQSRRRSALSRRISSLSARMSPPRYQPAEATVGATPAATPAVSASAIMRLRTMTSLLSVRPRNRAASLCACALNRTRAAGSWRVHQCQNCSAAAARRSTPLRLDGAIVGLPVLDMDQQEAQAQDGDRGPYEQRFVY